MLSTRWSPDQSVDSFKGNTMDKKLDIFKKQDLPEPLNRAPQVRGDGIQWSYEFESGGDDNVLKKKSNFQNSSFLLENYL